MPGLASVTRPFCGTCDRPRLTADGQVRTCLFAREEPDLRGTPPGRRTRRSRRGGSARGFPDRPSAVPGHPRCPPAPGQRHALRPGGGGTSIDGRSRSVPSGHEVAWNGASARQPTTPTEPDEPSRPQPYIGLG
ncbi:hypothetical protein BOG92_049195 [Streptomyces sp. WAC00263]|nr:hypothetical protein BOG92_049195 [Streptomyces sp. WAC00263]